jgi:hypothetical protein
MVATGIIFAGVGIGSFFSSFGTFQPPRYFWCAFVGLPLIGLGVFICQMAFLGTFARYVAGETAPVSKDTFNYLAAGTKDSVRDLAAAVGEGLSSGVMASNHESAPAHVLCPKCNSENEPAAHFCNQCGAPLDV